MSSKRDMVALLRRNKVRLSRMGDVFERSLGYVDAEREHTLLARNCISAAGGLLRLTKEVLDLEVRAKRRPRSGENKAELLRKAAAISKRAQAEARRKYRTLFTHSLVGMWSILEATVRDVVRVEVSCNRRSIVARPEKILIASPKRTARALQSSQQHQVVVLLDGIEKSCDKRRGFQKLKQMLACVGLTGAIERSVASRLDRMWVVRNVLVHNAGVVDRALVSRCPEYASRLGQHVVVSESEYLAYMRAIDVYLGVIIKRVRQSVRQKDGTLMGTHQTSQPSTAYSSL